MRKRRLALHALALVLVAMLLLPALAACGAKATATPPPAATAAPAATEAPAATQAPGATEAPAATQTGAALEIKEPTAPKPKKLTAIVYEPVEQKAFQSAGDEFKAKYGIDVEVQAVPWANLHEKMIADLTAQSGTYDLMWIPGLWSLEFINAGYIEPLSDYWNNPNLTKFDIEDYPKSVVDLVSKDGKAYWIPDFANTQILFYRKDLFEAEGLKPPETYDEMFKIAEKFTNNPKYPGVWGFGTTPKQGEWASSVWSTWLWSWGGDYFDQNWKPIFNSDKAVASLKAFADAVQKYSPPDSPNWGNEEAGAAFQQGKLAMLQMWPNLFAAMEDPSQSQVVGKVGYAPMPKQELRFPRLGSWGGTVSKFSKSKEWAYTFLAFANSKEMVEKYQVPDGVSVSRTSVTASPELQKQYPYLPAVITSYEHTKERPGIPEITPIIDVWGLAVSKVVTKQADAKAALDEAVPAVEKILKDAGYYSGGAQATPQTELGAVQIKEPTAAKPKKLTAIVYEPVEQKAFQSAGDEFKAKYGIDVEVQAVPWANLHEKMIADLTAQSGTYDLMWIPGLWSLEFINAGYIEPLSDYWNNPNLTKFDIEDYPKSVVDLVSKDGKAYWIPDFANTQILFYRKDLFEAEGLKPPETYDEMFKIAEKFTNNPKYPGVWGFGTTPKQGEWASSVWSTWLWSWGGDYFDQNWKPIFNSDKAVASLKAFADAVQKYSPPDSPNWGNEEAGAAFQQGKLAMLQMWPNLFAAMEDPSQSQVVGKVGYAPMPKQELRFPRLGSWGGTVSKFSKSKEWAYTFLAFANSKEMVEKYQVPDGVSVSRTSVTASPELQKQYPYLPAVITSYEHTKERPGIPEITPIIDVWGLAVSKVVTKQADAKTALDEAVAPVEKILKDAGYYDK